MVGRKASNKMIAAASPPAGFEPIVSSSPFGWENGPVFEKGKDGLWLRGFRVAERHSNAGGMCHGGMLMTFADILLSRAVLDEIEPPFVTVRLVTDFVGPARIGDWVEGEASAQNTQDGIVSVTGRIYTDRGNVAAVSAIFKSLSVRG